MTVKTLYKHIESTPGTMGGEPRISGRRISVRNIVLWHEHQRMSPSEIAGEYSLTLGEVYAALSYYFDHREEIDERIKESDAFVDSLREQAPSVLARKLAGSQRG